MGGSGPGPGPDVTVSAGDFLWFVDLALDGMTAMLRQLGDDGANRRIDSPGANTPYAILTHCLGVMAFWGGHIVAGRTIERDRAAEFTSSGPVEDLILRAEAARRQLELDLTGLDSRAAPTDEPAPEDAGVPYGRSKGGVLLHVLEELLQHLGQMEVTRDVLVAGDRP